MGVILTIIFGALMMLGTLGYWCIEWFLPIISAMIGAAGFGAFFLELFKLTAVSLILPGILLLEFLIIAAVAAVIDGT